MKGIQKIIYWQRLGLKVYDVSNPSPVLEKDLNSNQPESLISELNYLNGQTILILLDNSISYLYEKTIDPPLALDNNFKNKLLDIIKSDIPEDFSEFNWDYKVGKDSENKQKITIFAPTKEFQLLINQISNQLNIKIAGIEPQSIALTRDPDPIVGILKKPDLNGKDEEVLNISIVPNVKTKNSFFLKFIFFIVLLLALFTAYYIIKALPKSSTSKTPTATISPTSAPTSVPTIAPTPIIKSWSNLNIIVKNGTSKSGLASKTAVIIENSGVTQVDTANADNTDYLLNKLVFKDSSLKESHQKKFKELFIIKDENITIDNSIENDVILILGLN